MTERESLPRQGVVLWRCPRCGGTDPDTSQSGRVCSRTKACAKVKRSGIIENTRMERVAYVPAPLVERLIEVGNKLADALEYEANPGCDEWDKARYAVAPCLPEANSATT